MTLAEITSNSIAGLALAVSLWVASSKWRTEGSAHRQNARAYRDWDRDGGIAVFMPGRRQIACLTGNGRSMPEGRERDLIGKADRRWKRTGKVRVFDGDTNTFYVVREPYS